MIKKGSKSKIPINDANMSNIRLSKNCKISANIQIAKQVYIKLTSHIKEYISISKT